MLSSYNCIKIGFKSKQKQNNPCFLYFIFQMKLNLDLSITEVIFVQFSSSFITQAKSNV